MLRTFRRVSQMPPKKLKSREGNAELTGQVTKFPFRVGDEVEMKSFESGYRGAWFRVQIKRILWDRKGNILCTMVYKDYTDESEEEILAFETDPVTNKRILMARPLPPPSVKESKFNNSASLHTKMCAIYRDEWEIGDLVDWWYHHCWWAAKVISVVGDGRFQLVCPAPPGGEGGVYLANSRDLRPSLKWSAGTWTAPPSKEIGKRPCARIVRLLDSNEIADFAGPNQDHVTSKRGRPRMLRSSPFDKNAVAVTAPLKLDREPWKTTRPRMMHLASPTLRPLNQGTAESAVLKRDAKPPQKRGRPRKMEVAHEEVTVHRRKPFVIKVIHPRQDPTYEKVEQMLKNSSVGDRLFYEERRYDIQSADEILEGGALIKGKRPEEETATWMNAGNEATENPSEKDQKVEIQNRPSAAAKQVPTERRPGVKQKRSVMRMSDRFNVTRGNPFSNGHSDEAKRRKLDHLRGGSGVAALDIEKNQNSADRDGVAPDNWKDVNEQEACAHMLGEDLMTAQSKDKNQKKFEEKVVAVKSKLLMNCVQDVHQHVLDPVTREQLSRQCMDEEADDGKEMANADQMLGQQSTVEMQYREDLQAEVFSSSKFVTNPMNDESMKMLREEGNACKDVVDLNVLKVLTAYEEAFTNKTSLEVRHSCFRDDPSSKMYPTAVRSDIRSMRQHDILVVNAYEEVFIKDIWSPRRKSSLSQDTSPVNRDSKMGDDANNTNNNNNKKKPWERTVSGNRDKKSAGVSSFCKRISSRDAKLRSIATLQGSSKHQQPVGNASPISLGNRKLLDLATRKDATSSSLDRISGGDSGAQGSSFSGRTANVSTSNSADKEKEGDAGVKDVGDSSSLSSSHGGASGVDEESGSSLNLLSSQYNHSRKNARPARVRLPSSGNGDDDAAATLEAGAQVEKKNNNHELISVRKRIPKPVMKRKVTLSRKLIDQARREVSAKRRRSICSSRVEA